MVIPSPRSSGPDSASNPCARLFSSAARTSGASSAAGSSTRRLQGLQRSGQQRDQMIGPVAQRSVIERAMLLGDKDGRPAQQAHQPCGPFACLFAYPGDGEAGADHALDFTGGIASEGHRRVDRGSDGAPRRQRREGSHAAAAADMGHQRSMGEGARIAQIGDNAPQRVIGDRDQDDVAGLYEPGQIANSLRAPDPFQSHLNAACRPPPDQGQRG